MNGYLLLVFGLTGLLSGCLAADCSFYTLKERMDSCVTFKPSMTSISQFKAQLQTFCNRMDANIRCQEAAWGPGCRGHYNAVGNRVASAIICANVDHTVHAMFECMLGEPTCGTSWARSLMSASQSYISTGDVASFRAAMCNDFSIFSRDCLPFRVTSSCPAAYSDFAGDLFELSLTGPTCTDRNMSALYTKYGFTANGEPIPGRKHDVPITHVPYTIHPEEPFRYRQDDMQSDPMKATDVLGHGLTGHAHRHVTLYSRQGYPSGGSQVQMSVISLLFAVCASLRFYFAI